MITKFETYKEPQEGDYVLLSLGMYPHANNELLNDEDVEEIEKCIGYILNIDPNDGYTKYHIQVDSNDEHINNLDLWVDKEEIIEFSPDRDDIEMILTANKYNI
jgi:hypothetical protein